MHTKSREKKGWTQLIWSPCGAVHCARKRDEKEEFSSVRVSGEKNWWSAGEVGLRLVQYNPSLAELVSLDSGPHKPSHTAPMQPQAQARQDCFHSPAPHRQMPRAMGLTDGSQIKPVVFKRSQHSFLSHRHPHVIPTQEPEEWWSKLQWAMSFCLSPYTLLAEKSSLTCSNM